MQKEILRGLKDLRSRKEINEDSPIEITFNGNSMAVKKNCDATDHLLPSKQVVEQLLRLAEEHRRAASAKTTGEKIND